QTLWGCEIACRRGSASRGNLNRLENPLHYPWGVLESLLRWTWAQEVHTVFFSIRTERALEALGRLAAIATPGQRVYLEDILDGTDAPRAFLSKVFTRLSRAGIVTSLRGRFGGYTLAR